VLVATIWAKAIIIPGLNPNLVRKDICGASIYKNEYGNRDNAHGWEIDHIIAIANGGDNSLNNLRPLQWQNNAERSDGQLACPVRTI